MEIWSKSCPMKVGLMKLFHIEVEAESIKKIGVEEEDVSVKMSNSSSRSWIL